jgi:hypothetical protein
MDPSSTDTTPGKTDYVFVTGKGTIFEAGANTRLPSITDGTSNTLMMIEVKSAGVHWAEPRDFDLSQPTTLPPGNHPNINVVLFADGSVRSMSKTVSPQVLHQLGTKSGGEPVSPP